MLLQAAFQGRKITTGDVRAVYLHAEMNNFVVIKLQGPVVDILCETKPEYKKFVVLENGKKTLLHATDEGSLWMHQIGAIVV